MDIVISTSRLNCYGSRVLTEGIDTTQYEKNPVLLWMHMRGYSKDSMPIGRVENLKKDGDRLIGTLVFDENDEFAKKVCDKMKNGFLKMASAGLEIIETSVDPALLLPGQTRATVTKSRLNEVSIVDIGGNDDALVLMNDGKLLTLSAGEACEVLPLINMVKTESGESPESVNKNDNKNEEMNKEFLKLLGLAETATEQEAIEALKLMKTKADKAESIELAAITSAVDGAIAERRLSEAKKEQFITLGKKMGLQTLTDMLSCMQPMQKPKDLLNLSNDEKQKGDKEYLKLSDVPADKLAKLKTEKPAEYAKLYKAEYGVELS